MAITNQNVSVYRGDSTILTVTLEDSNGDAYAPQPGDTVLYRVARNSHSLDADAFITKTLNSGLTILAGVATIELSPTDTDLEPGLYHHMIRIVDPPSDRSTVMTGTFKVRT